MDKKAKKKKDREAKQKAARKSASRSPFELLNAPPVGLKVLITGRYDDIYDVVVLARRDMPHGLIAMAELHLARDVSGLRLAGGVLDATETEWDDMLASFCKEGSEQKDWPVEIEPAKALGYILGGARVASENGLRLPDKWDKWARVIGATDGWKEADTSFFDPVYAGDLSELQERLVGYSFEAFLERTDIDIDPEDDFGWYTDEPSPELALDGLEDNDDEYSPQALLGKAGETVSPEFDTAQHIHLQAGIAAFPDLSRDMNMKPADSPLWQASIEKQLSALPAERQDDVRAALAQYERYSKLVGSLELPPDDDKPTNNPANRPGNDRAE